MSRQYLHTINENDFNLQPTYICVVIGRILPTDVGKRIYDVNGTIQVENNEQRNKRESRAAQR